MTVLVQCKLPGTPIPREQLITPWEDLHYSEPEQTYQWRIQLACGCQRAA
jgi:hypothetical protein